jgi:hypothetical protein
MIVFFQGRMVMVELTKRITGHRHYSARHTKMNNEVSPYDQQECLIVCEAP